MLPERADLSLSPDTRLRFVLLLAELSSRFINLAPAKLDLEIEDALRSVCELLGIDTAVLSAVVDRGFGCHLSHARIPLFDSSRNARLIAETQFPWIRQEMLAGRAVVLPSVEESLPALGNCQAIPTV